MAVYVNNITLNTGEYFSRDFYLDNIDGTPLDLTGYTAASQMRKHPESVKQTADFNVGFIDRANGRIRVSLATTTTRLVKPGRYVWDVMFTEGQGPSSNAGVWSTLDANNSGSYRGFTINAWSSFMNTYAYSRVPQSGSLSSQPDPYGVKTDSYVVNFPYTGAYQIEAAADNVGTVTINNTTFNAVHYGDTNVGVGSISLEKGNHTVTLTQQNTQSSTDNFAENPVGLAVSITYIGGTAPGKKSIVIEGNVLATPDITPTCVKTDYTYDRLGIIVEAPGVGQSDQSNPAATGHDNIGINDITDYGVVHMGVNFNQCSTFDIGSSVTRDLLEDSSSLEKINQYLQLGGVIWLNTEWWGGSASGRACSDRSNINAMLTLLGTEIRTSVDQGFVGNADRSSEVSVINSGFPLTENHNASVIFTGGTPVYTIESGTKVVGAYEKIGQGILFVQGDSNIFPGPAYPETYYNALRSLVLNS